MSALGVGYTIATGRLFCPIAELHAELERLLRRPVYTHEMGSEGLWERARAALEAEATAAEVGTS